MPLPDTGCAEAAAGAGGWGVVGGGGGTAAMGGFGGGAALGGGGGVGAGLEAPGMPPGGWSSSGFGT